VTASLRIRLCVLAILGTALGGVGGCIYRISVQQGNLLEASTVEQVQLGMTKSQVQFLLGTPMVQDVFHENRWDYTYYLQAGRSSDVDRRWLIVFFEGDRVVRIDRDALLNPDS